MRQGQMYRMKNLSKNRVNTCMQVHREPKRHGEPVYNELATENPRYVNGPFSFGGDGVAYNDGTLVVCLGVEMRDTHHYCKQPFYNVLLPNGTIAQISKSTRTKYFELVRPEQNTRESNNNKD